MLQLFNHFDDEEYYWHSVNSILRHFIPSGGTADFGPSAVVSVCITLNCTWKLFIPNCVMILLSSSIDEVKVSNPKNRIYFNEVLLVLLFCRSIPDKCNASRTSEFCSNSVNVCLTMVNDILKEYEYYFFSSKTRAYKAHAKYVCLIIIYNGFTQAWPVLIW